MSRRSYFKAIAVSFDHKGATSSCTVNLASPHSSNKVIRTDFNLFQGSVVKSFLVGNIFAKQHQQLDVLILIPYWVVQGTIKDFLPPKWKKCSWEQFPQVYPTEEF